MNWWEQWKVTIYSVTSELEQLAHKKQHQTRDSLHAHMHMVAANAIENLTSKGATAMLTKAHKRINDWETQQTQAKRRQRVTYGVNIAEHLHPSYLNQTNEQKPKTKIPHLQKHEVHEYFPHLTPPIERGDLELQPSSTNRGEPSRASGDTPPPPDLTQNDLELQEEIPKFYENLYKNEEPDHLAMSQVIQLLTQKQVASWQACEGPITEEELRFVVKRLTMASPQAQMAYRMNITRNIQMTYPHS
jgi:hypothetical protein